MMATYFADVTLFDGRAVRRKAGVLVADGRIQWVGYHARAPREAKAAAYLEAPAARSRRASSTATSICASTGRRTSSVRPT